MRRSMKYDPGWKAQRRATLFHILLRDILNRVSLYRVQEAQPCPFCGDENWFDNAHAEGCIVARIETALAAGSDEIKAMLDDFGRNHNRNHPPRN